MIFIHPISTISAINASWLSASSQTSQTTTAKMSTNNISNIEITPRHHHLCLLEYWHHCGDYYCSVSKCHWQSENKQLQSYNQHPLIPQKHRAREKTKKSRVCMFVLYDLFAKLWEFFSCHNPSPKSKGLGVTLFCCATNKKFSFKVLF